MINSHLIETEINNTSISIDTNINIKLDVDAPDAASEYLERGYDEEKKMKYYKVYFNEEK